uniref:Si:ch211-113g11.6 n=1 Tax=Hippocampus comes TaxID=109280 RepID=A0A3Q2YBR0_HIPCM
LFAAAVTAKPARLKFVVHPSRFHFDKPENYISMYHQEGSDTLYVGGQAVIYVLTFSNRGVRDLECDNFITVIEKVNDTFIVCGTNAGSPRCWMLQVNDTVLTDIQGVGQIASPADISPPYPSQKSISLPAGSLYSAMSAVGGHVGSIRRTFGPQKLLKTENVWLLPQFAGAAIIPSTLKYKEEIYFFFSEINKTARVDEEPYRARIGRICTVDEGGIKNLLADSWTTFMKARVMCGAGNTQQQYNSMKQAVVLTAEDKRAGVMYGLFSNARGRTVICAYSIEDIDQAFSTSKLKGYSNSFIGNRPGMNSSAGNDLKNLGVIRYHPEIEDVIRPVGVAPLDLPTDDQITHTVADIVLAVNDEHYSVLYLGTQGKVLKVLHSSDGVFIISQYSMFRNEGPVLNMAINPQKGHLYVATAMEVQRLPLADCGRYGDTCRECILSRDPYCGWDKARRRCIAIPPLKLRRTSPRQVSVPSNTSIFLPCPVRSFHATYRWEKDNCVKNYPCLFSGDFCVLGPAVDTPLREGVFRCMATEDGFKVEVISFKVVSHGRLLAASLASTMGPSLLLAMAAL